MLLDGRALVERIAAGDERAKACFRCFGEQLCDALRRRSKHSVRTRSAWGQMASAALFLHPLEKLCTNKKITLYITQDTSLRIHAGADKSCQPVGIYQSAYISEKFQSMEHFKQELVEYLDYYNNRRIRVTKGLAACNSQTTSPFGYLNNFTSKYGPDFWDHLKTADVLLFIW